MTKKTAPTEATEPVAEEKPAGEPAVNYVKVSTATAQPKAFQEALMEAAAGGDAAALTGVMDRSIAARNTVQDLLKDCRIPIIDSTKEDADFEAAVAAIKDTATDQKKQIADLEAEIGALKTVIATAEVEPRKALVAAQEAQAAAQKPRAEAVDELLGKVKEVPDYELTVISMSGVKVASATPAAAKGTGGGGGGSKEVTLKNVTTGETVVHSSLNAARKVLYTAEKGEAPAHQANAKNCRNYIAKQGWSIVE